MPRLLSLSTYPVAKPIHGGQRRIDAFARYLGEQGWSFTNAAVYDGGHYARSDVGPNDIPLKYLGAEWRGVPLVGDIQAGDFAASSQAAYQHFRAVAERTAPDVVQLEQVFLWPLVKRLRAEGVARDAKLIYSSQNWEAPLKYDMLRDAGMDEDTATRASSTILRMEKELAAEADAIVAVSTSDAAHYRTIAPNTPVFVVPNGVSAPVTPSAEDESVREIFDGRKSLVFVGSAYPPNVDGFVRLVLKNGFFFSPPEKCMAICGGVSHGIFSHPDYRALAAANGRRVQFFPDVSDGQLEALKRGAHAMLLPIQFGGGSNLKTAEAIASGCWVIATSVALRGFERFRDAPGVLVANTADEFRDAIVKVLAAPPLVLTADQVAARASVYWSACFEGSDYLKILNQKGRHG